MKRPYNPDYKGKNLVLARATPVERHTARRNSTTSACCSPEKTTMTEKDVGVVLNKLKELGLYDNTLIIWLSITANLWGTRNTATESVKMPAVAL